MLTVCAGQKTPSSETVGYQALKSSKSRRDQIDV